MIKKNIFREYDIRGSYPTDINEETAYVIGQSYGSILQERYHKNIICIGRDNRLSSPSLHQNLLKGLIETGINVIDLGLVTTPMFFYGCLKCNTLGMMITASHNPKDDNGFKFSFDMLGNARGKQVYDFRDYTLAAKFINSKNHGHIKSMNILPYYKSLIKDNIDMANKKIKVVIDPGNGTTSLFAKEIFEQFPNLDIHMINDISDPTFPNHHPDPAVEENLKQLQQEVIRLKADIGIAFDGDGDRVGFVDEHGQIISTDKFMVIVLRYFFPRLADKRILYDVKCSKIVSEEAQKVGGKAIMCRTGASYTRSKINQDNIPFGGEFSGHFVFKNNFPGFDSGIIAGLRMLEILSHSSKPVSNLLDGITLYYNTPEIKIPVTDDNKFEIVEQVKKYCQNQNYSFIDIDGIRLEFNDAWLLIRASNTGPNLTLRFEATTKEKMETLKEEFISLINKIIAQM